MNNTTRRYSRYMAEAFPFGPEYASAIERYKPLNADKFVGWTVAFAAVFVAVLLIVEAL